MRFTNLLLSLTAFITYAAGAANWYVDKDAIGSNSGTSWANAWQSATNIVWASVSAGDTVYVSGGTTSKTYSDLFDNGSGGTTAFSIGKSGSAGNPITVSVGVDAGHNGRVIIDGGNSATWTFTCGGSYTRLIGPSTNLWIVNASYGANREAGIAYFGGVGSHQYVSGVVVSNANNGIYYNGGSDNEICNSKFYDIRGDYAIAALGGLDAFDSIKIHHNYISHNVTPISGGPDGIHFIKGSSIYCNEFTNATGTVIAGQHPDSIQCATPSAGVGSGNYTIIASNIFHAPYNACLELGVSEVVHDLWIINNVFTHDNPDLTTASHPAVMEASFELPSSTQPALLVSNIFILNNTAANFPAGLGWEWQKFANPAHPVATNIYFENNIVHNTGTPSLYSVAFGTYLNTNASYASFIINNNDMSAGATGSSKISFGSSAPGNYALTNLNGFTNDPSFVSATDFRLRSDSHCIGAGTNLNAFFTTDLVGSTRGSVWDIGAYEYITNSISGVVKAPVRLKGKARIK